MSAIFPMHLLKTWNIISYTAQIFAALREKVFASAAQLLGNGWHCASDNKNNSIGFLNGISSA